MTPATALEIAQWSLLAVAILALGGVTARLKLLEQRLTDSLGVPRRPQIGDHLRPPPHMNSLIPDGGVYLLFFGSAECKPCRRSYRRLVEETSLPPTVAIWRDSIPEYADKTMSMEAQRKTFEDLRVSVTPFAILLSGERVLAQSPLGSDRLTQEFISEVVDQSARARDPVSASERVR